MLGAADKEGEWAGVRMEAPASRGERGREWGRLGPPPGG